MSALLPLRDYQTEAIAELHRRWDQGHTRVPMVLATGLGKGHPLETDVPTPKGWRRWGDLEVGDLVFGRDGSSTEVLEVYDRGALPTYRVTFSDESSVVVDGDHLWTVRDSSKRPRAWGAVETRELARAKLRLERGYRFHVPMTAPLERPAFELPLDPYVVGALISNGSMTGTGTQLTTPDLEVAARVARATECNMIKDATPGICDRYSLPGLTRVTRELGMRVTSLEKRIPAAYLESSLEQRTALLNGLMDGDGAGRDASRRSVGYFTSSLGLARDVSELVTSLGGTGIVKRYDRPRGVEYAVRILLPSSVPAFSTTRKDDAGRSSTRNLQPKRAIVSVTLEGSSPIRCIRVAARDSLYLITRQHIVTHNTVIFAHLIADWVRMHVRKRVLVLVHTDELVQQAYKKIKDVAPSLAVGIVKAERNEVTARVIVASVQSLRSAKRRAQIRNVGMIIVDECHHATAATYRAILEHYEHCFGEEPTLVAGFTATLARGDKQKLSDIWQECTFTRGIAFGIRRGYLLDVRGKRIVVPDMELGNVKKSGGDYQDGSLAEELDRSLAPSIVASAYFTHAKDRKGLGFAPTVESAKHFADAFTEAGIPSEVVSGQTPREERRLILKRLRAGDVQVVWNCAVLTEGFDEPSVSCIVNARPTKSAPLYQQMIGRGLRPDLSLPPEQRGDCLVLDVAPARGTAHDLRTLIDLSSRPDVPEIDDEDLSLLEMEDALEALAEAEESGGQADDFTDEYYGETIAVDFDPLNRTGVGAWLSTTGGTYFLPVGNQAYILIVPAAEPGLWDVAWLTQAAGTFLHTACPDRAPYLSTSMSLCACGQGHIGSQGDLTDHRGLHLDMACSWAEEVMEELSGGMARGRADESWRKSKARASEKWFRLAARHGIPLQGTETRAQVSDLIDVHLGSRRIDPVIAFMSSVRSEDQE